MDRQTVEEIHTKLNKSMPAEYALIHPEEYGNGKLNSAIKNADNDLINIDKQIKGFATKVNNILERSTKRLDNVLKTIKSEKERLQDIIMLCNNSTDYENAIPLSKVDFTGEFGYEQETFLSHQTTSVNVKSMAFEVNGNGYEGNNYVIGKKGYLKDTLDTSARVYMSDGSFASYWEYSRIVASASEPYLISDFNTDDAEAKTTITFKFETAVNELAVVSDLDTIKVTAIRYSADNVNYEDVPMLPFILNNKTESYENEGYIYGSNIISFPLSAYVKVTFESTGYLNDTIAFERSQIVDEDTIENITTIVPSAKRHVIRINDLIAKQKRYNSTTIFKSRELIEKDTEIYAISLFANIYLPNNMPKDYLSFIMNVNGKEYPITPVNIHDNGKKIIRFSQGNLATEYTEYIGEKIQSAHLTVKMRSNGTLTPYINNLKILLGGEI